MDLISFQSAVSSLNVAKDIVKGMISLKSSTELNEKTIELQSVIIDLHSDLMAIQSQYQELLKSKSDLESQLVQMKNWDITASNYKIISVNAGNFVYEYQNTSEPKHWLCPNCFESQKKSILQCDSMSGGRKIHVSCPNCNTNFEAFYSDLPSYQKPN